MAAAQRQGNPCGLVVAFADLADSENPIGRDRRPRHGRLAKPGILPRRIASFTLHHSPAGSCIDVAEAALAGNFSITAAECPA